MAAVPSAMTYSSVEVAAGDAGLIVMGALHPARAGVRVPPSGTLILLGTGPGFWPVFSGSPEAADGRPDPVDRWSTRVVAGLAGHFGATPHYPFGGPPYAPFIQWALGSGRAHKSPTGMMVHDTVGLMISYRGALHFDDELDIPDPQTSSPCLNCDAPCTRACPVGALSADAPYDVARCHDYLATAPGADCMNGGCAARRACPVSEGAARDEAQSALHMKAFHPV